MDGHQIKRSAFESANKNADNRSGHTSGQGTGDDGTEPQRNDFLTSFRRHCPHSADHNPQTSGIGKTAHGICHNHQAFLAQSALCQTAHIKVGQKFVEDGFGSHKCAGHGGLFPRDTHKPDNRCHHQPKKSLQRNRLIAKFRQKRQDDINQVDQSHQHNEHGDDIDQELDTLQGSFGDRVHGTQRHFRRCQLSGGLPAGFRHHDLGNHDSRRYTDNRRCQNMPHNTWNNVSQNAGVEDHDRACYSGHSRGHECENLTSAHLIQIRADEKRGFDHTNKYIGRYTQSLGTAQSHGFLQCPGKGLYHHG